MDIHEFFSIYQDAAWRKDTTAMINLYHQDAVIFDMWDKGFHSNSSEWQSDIIMWLSSLGEETVRVEFDKIQIHQSGEAGFASALIRYQALSRGGTILRSMRNRISLGFVKAGSDWKVIHQHTSAPVSSSEMTAILDI